MRKRVPRIPSQIKTLIVELGSEFDCLVRWWKQGIEGAEVWREETGRQVIEIEKANGVCDGLSNNGKGKERRAVVGSKISPLFELRLEMNQAHKVAIQLEKQIFFLLAR